MDLRIQSVKVGSERTNCYIVSARNGETVVIDPGAEPNKIFKLLQNIKNLRLRYILLTHGHFDHVGAVDLLKVQFSEVPIMISENDVRLYRCVPEQGIFVSELLLQPKSELTAIADEEYLPFSETEIEVIATPGHTPGGVCYRIDKTLFTGDTLFYHTVGRTDLPFSDIKKMEASLNKIAHLRSIDSIYPGHGRETTLREELENNHYLK